MYSEGYVPDVMQSDKKSKKKSHLSHILGQQGLQLLDYKQTQAAHWAELLLEREN